LWNRQEKNLQFSKLLTWGNFLDDSRVKPKDTAY
jgi:hypothetical protein